MKIKKAIKHVRRAEELLAAVLEKTDTLPAQVGDLLRTATAAVQQAEGALADTNGTKPDRTRSRTAKDGPGKRPRAKKGSVKP